MSARGIPAVPVIVRWLVAMDNSALTVTQFPSADVVPFDPAVAYRFLKIKKSSPKFDELRDLVASRVDACRSCLKPAYRYAVRAVEKVDISTGRVVLSGNSTMEGTGLCNRLERSREAAFFVLTLGEDIERMISEADREDVLSSYLLHGVSSAFVQGLLSLVELDLAHTAESRGSKLTSRFSPGYHRWELPQQRRLFDLTDAGEIGLRLTEGYYVVPPQSLTGVYGLVTSHSEEA